MQAQKFTEITKWQSYNVMMTTVIIISLMLLRHHNVTTSSSQHDNSFFANSIIMSVMLLGSGLVMSVQAARPKLEADLGPSVDTALGVKQTPSSTLLPSSRK